jgi:hypothetical protein
LPALPERGPGEETGDLKVFVKDETGLTLFSIRATAIEAACTLHRTSKQTA